ncbi:MAG: type II secretion system F family protein [Coriobacteriia bacterium]|nr:type II secretion system F family protein [Coriobacteriia bacterium]
MTNGPLSCLLQVPNSAFMLLAGLADPTNMALASAIILTVICGSIALPMAFEGLQSRYRRLERKQRAIDNSNKPSFMFDLLRNGLPALSPVSNFMLKFSFWQERIENTTAYLSTRGFKTNTQSISELAIALCLSTSLLVYLTTDNGFVSCVSIVSAPMLVNNQILKLRERRNQKMRGQLPDALQCMGFCFLAGCSLEQAIEQTAAETLEPLKHELTQVSDDIRSGLGLKEALAALEERNKLPELSFLAAALEIQHQTGGSLADLIETAAESIRTSISLKRQLQSQTAQARLSYKVVALMPVLLVVALSLTVDGYAATFVSSTMGFVMLLVAVTMELSGILIIRRILGVDLG